MPRITRPKLPNRSLRGRRIASVVLCVLLVSSVGGVTAADRRAASESELKAAFLFNFLKFTEWPPAAIEDDHLEIGVVGMDANLDLIREMLDGRKFRDQTLVVKNYSDPDNLGPCHILYIGEPQGTTTEKLLAAVQDDAVLTIGESENFIRAGGIIRFIKQDDRIRFEINPVAAERAGLQISSRLLKVAQIVAP